MSDSLSLASHVSPSESIAQMQSELDSLRGELEHSQRLATLGVIAAGVAHEINNVLTPVLAYAQLAGSNPTDSQFQAKALQKAIVGVETATQIAQSMLGFAGRPEQLSLANILEALNAAVDCLGRNPEKDKIDFQINIHPDAYVRIRPLALQQIFMNLILNAISALPKKGGRLSIVAEQSPTGSTLIHVADTGPGIPPEAIDQIFQPFISKAATSTKNVRSKKSAGSGLGLHICKRLIEEAQGEITVQSKIGEGATFTLCIPSAQYPHIAA